MMLKQTMPEGSEARKGVPIVTGVLDYFPAALAEVAKLSKLGNDKHNPGEPLHWARGKSMDHADCIGRHLTDRGIIDPDTGLSHTVEIAWRALALLQEELEAAGAPVARGARLPENNMVPDRPRYWNEGWKCLVCGTTEIFNEYVDTDMDRLLKHNTTPLCDTNGCYHRMVRV